MHWRFGDYVKSGILLRKAYKRLEQLQAEHPDFIEINKSLGILHVLLSSVPSEYDWIINLFGFQNNQSRGLSELEKAAREDNYFREEAKLLLSYVNIFVLDKEQEGLKQITSIKHTSSLNTFAYMIICNKIGKNQEGLNEIYQDRWIYSPKYLKPALSFLRGEFHLKQLEYDQAIFNLRNFLLTYPGNAFIDNARLKLFYAYYLNREFEEAENMFSPESERKSDFSTSDIYAQNVLKTAVYPDSILLKSRLLFDGGYFEQALKEVNLFPYKSSSTQVSAYEYYYRLGRIHQKLNNLDSAIHAFIKCIEIQGRESYYFAPNASLQLGRIYRLRGDTDEALRYFEKAQEYKRYPYRRSIEHQAKAAINEIR